MKEVVFKKFVDYYAEINNKCILFWILCASALCYDENFRAFIRRMIFVSHRCRNAFFWPFLNATKSFFSFWQTKKLSYGDRTKSLPFGSQVRRFKNLKMRGKKSNKDGNAPLSLKMILWSWLRRAGASRFQRAKWSFLKFILNIGIAGSWRSKNSCRSGEQEEWRSFHFWAFPSFFLACWM